MWPGGGVEGAVEGAEWTEDEEEAGDSARILYGVDEVDRGTDDAV